MIPRKRAMIPRFSANDTEKFDIYRLRFTGNCNCGVCSVSRKKANGWLVKVRNKIITIWPSVNLLYQMMANPGKQGFI